MASLDTIDAPARGMDQMNPTWLMDHPDSTEKIPILDISPYMTAQPGGREAVAKRLREITETVGFFYLKGHGVPDDLVDRVFAESRRFHALPTEVKNRVPHKYVNSFQTGYIAPATPRPEGANINLIKDAKPNLQGKFLVTRELEPSNPDHYTINVWPEDLPDFRETVSEYHAAIEKLGRTMLPLWATSLGMPTDFFDQFFRAPHVTLSLLHYPPQRVVGDRQYGIAPHTDNSFMTFLAQSSVPGLAVMMPSGHWRIVENIPGTFLVNTGNVITRWTNDLYLSTKHSVVNSAGVDRYSIPVFFGPSGDAMIECIPTCASAERPVRHEPLTYKQLRQWYYGIRD